MMITILSMVFGFVAPFLPELLKYFNRKIDNAHEIEMFKLRLDASKYEHMYRMEEISAQADIAEMTTLRQPQQSFGVQLLDAATKAAFSKWMIAPAFFLFTILDFVSGMVRPTITYAAFGFYCAVKTALYHAALASGQDPVAAILAVWTENDFAVLMTVISYYFGTRTAKAAFGGSAMTSYKGA